MEDHETRRKIIREWMALPRDKRHTEEQVVAFAKRATQQNEFHRSRRDPVLSIPGGSCTRKLWDGSCLALESYSSMASLSPLWRASGSGQWRIFFFFFFF